MPRCPDCNHEVLTPFMQTKDKHREVEIIDYWYQCPSCKTVFVR